MSDQPSADRISELLGQVPEAAALHLRDIIRGLEAEAGNARAAAAELQAALDGDINRLRLYAAGLRAELESAENERDTAKQDLVLAQAELAALRTEAVSHRRGWNPR